jgi:hypothetical protein
MCLDVITNKLLNEGVDFVATIHDSWIIKRKDIGTFNKIIEELPLLGIEPPKIKEVAIEPPSEEEVSPLF